MTLFTSKLASLKMLSETLEQLRRDVSTVVSSVLGRPPSPLVTRKPRHKVYASAAPPVTATVGRSMRIEAIVRETSDTVSLVLANPSGAPIDFLPGQFFTLVVPVEGELLRRAYSASSSPGEHGGRVRISVKRVEGGKVSSRLVSAEQTRVGEVLTVLGPSGSFVPSKVENGAERHLLLVAGGSGITPMMAITKTLLLTEPNTKLSLLYGNRSEHDIPFREELDTLAKTSAGRFTVRHVLSTPSSDWSGGTGLLTRDVLDRELPALLGERTEGVYVCGPEPMMLAAREALTARGVDPARVHEERFASPKPKDRAPTSPVEVTITVNGASKRVLQTVGQTLLEAGLSAGLDMPYSCAMGGCGACKVHVAEGETTQDGAALTDAERREGYVLACVDRALGPCAIAVQK